MSDHVTSATPLADRSDQRATLVDDAVPVPGRSRRLRLWPRRRHDRYTAAPLLMISANLALFLTFFVGPASLGFYYSFTSYSGVGDAPWVGLDNYRRLFGDENFFAALIRTLIFAVGAVPMIFVASLLMAVVLVSPYSKGKGLARALFFLPWLVSPIIAGVIWRWIFGENFGLVNYLIMKFGGQAQSWQSDGNLSLIIVIVAVTWGGTAFNMLLFVSALKNVPTAYYEAAQLDGANGWQRFRYITLPAIAPTSFIVILLSTLNSMKEYATVNAINGGGPGSVNNFVVMYIYRTGFEQANIGYASAASFVLMLILMLISIIQLWLNSRREDS